MSNIEGHSTKFTCGCQFSTMFISLLIVCSFLSEMRQICLQVAAMMRPGQIFKILMNDASIFRFLSSSAEGTGDNPL